MMIWIASKFRRNLWAARVSTMPYYTYKLRYTQTRTNSGNASHGHVWSYNCWVC